MITSEWQIIDPDNGLCMPWFTHPCLEELRKWDLKDKRVVEYGAGNSTIWWGQKCKEVFAVEANNQWYIEVRKQMPANVTLELRCVNEGDQSQVEFYTAVPDGFIPDIVVVDGILRYECLKKGIELLSPHGGIIIADNWKQDYVWICPACEELMKPYEAKICVQENHTNHEGNPWKTAIFTIPPK